MLSKPAQKEIGNVVSLHLHSKEPGELFQNVLSFQVEAGKGIVGNPRYFARRSRSGGFSKRQVSLMEREQIAEHAATLGLECIAPGRVRSNIETTGVDLIQLIGRHVKIGSAVLYFYEARIPCSKMDEICQGLRELMSPNRQGVMAQVVTSGIIQIGDAICAAEESEI